MINSLQLNLYSTVQIIIWISYILFLAGSYCIIGVFFLLITGKSFTALGITVRPCCRMQGGINIKSTFPSLRVGKNKSSSHCKLYLYILVMNYDWVRMLFQVLCYSELSPGWVLADTSNSILSFLFSSCSLINMALRLSVSPVEEIW